MKIKCVKPFHYGGLKENVMISLQEQLVVEEDSLSDGKLIRIQQIKKAILHPLPQKDYCSFMLVALK